MFEPQTYLIGSAEASESNVSRAPLCFRDGKEEDKVSDEEEDVGDDESKLEDCTSSSSSSSLSSEMEDMKQEEDEDSELSYEGSGNRDMAESDPWKTQCREERSEAEADIARGAYPRKSL